MFAWCRWWTQESTKPQMEVQPPFLEPTPYHRQKSRKPKTPLRHETLYVYITDSPELTCGDPLTFTGTRASKAGDEGAGIDAGEAGGADTGADKVDGAGDAGATRKKPREPPYTCRKCKRTFWNPCNIYYHFFCLRS